MKNIGTLVAAVALTLVLLLYMCTFQVRFTEVAIKKTWGNPADKAISEPGLKFKWPRPIQSVVLYDKRIRIMEDRTEETRTVDGKNVLLTTFTLWKIADPSKFHTNFPGGVDDGEKKLRTTIVTAKHAVAGQHEFGEFVSMDAGKRKIRQIEQEVKLAVADGAAREYGIEVVDFGIKRLGLPQSVTSAIFESMKSAEQKKASKYAAEGEATATSIVAEAKAAEDRIIAEVNRKVTEIETEGERLVSGYYKEFKKYPQLQIFLDKIRTVAQALQQRSTLILTDDDSPFDVFDDEARRQVPILDGVLGDPDDNRSDRSLPATSLAKTD